MPSAGGAAATLSVRFAVRSVNPGADPVSDSVYVPAATVRATATASRTLPPRTSCVLAGVTVTPAGAPVVVKVTGPAKPPVRPPSDTSVYRPIPAVRLSAAGLNANEYPGAGVTVTGTFAASVSVRRPVPEPI